MTNIQLFNQQIQLPAKQENFVKLFNPQQCTLPQVKADFSALFSPVKCLVVLNKVNSPALCLNSGAPSLAAIRKHFSDDYIIAYIALWIDNLNDFVNANRKMTSAQMEETAVILFQEYHYLNLADINLVFRRIKKGEFGMLFSEIDGVKILGWFDLYAQERMRAAIEINQSTAFDAHDNYPRAREKKEAEKIANIRAKGFHTIEQANK